MKDNKQLLREYIEKKKELTKLGEEAGILLMNNIKNDRWKQLEIDINYITQDMNSIAKSFIEGFILD